VRWGRRRGHGRRRESPRPVEPDQPGDDRVGEAALAAMAAEYTALRSEIGRCQDHQKDLINVAFVLLGAMFAFIGVVSSADTAERDFGRVLLLVPLLYGLLGFACADRARRMLELARYIAFDLRPKAEAGMSSRAEIWRWEQYKREQWERGSLPRRILALTLDKARWLVFVVPSLIALFAFWRLVGFHEAVDQIFLGADSALIVLTLITLLLAEETRGLKPPAA
jgi:hypothetical protein